MVVAINEATAEVKYFVTNASASVKRVLAVAFRRATIEQAFRVAKSEAGLMHYEGRQWVGLVRHLVLAVVVLGFVAEQTARLRGEKPVGDSGAGVPGVERAVCGGVRSSSGPLAGASGGRGDPVSPATQRAGDSVPQETAA